MTNRKRVFWATTALFSGMILASTANAQSTGTTAAEATNLSEVIVTGSRGPREVAGAVAQTVDKTRSTITQELITRQTPGQTIFQSLNLVPGLNFTNSDPYGGSGGSIRLRGFDGNRVGLAFDGVPLNDTGNFATFTNQLLDPELIERASVNQGTTDNDSPTAAALGGIVNFTSARPYEEPGVQVNSSIGEFNYGRVFLRTDTGAFGPWGTTAYVTLSRTEYDKFKGPGDLEKTQFNGKVYQDLGEGNFASVAAHYNRNRNSFYNNLINLATFNAGGPILENDQACFRPLGANGSVQNELTSSERVLSDGTFAIGSCTNYHGLRINPSDTGNIRGNFSYGLTDKLRLTIDPSFQYVTANGGGFTVFQERDDRLDQNPLNNNNANGVGAITNAQCLTAAFRNTGVDLNGDGDSCDNVSLYTPNNTKTRRYGVIASLIWDVTDDHRFRLSYTNDYGRHRQTAETGFLDRNANPLNVYAGQQEEDQRVFGRDGSFLRTRDRFSLAILNQFSLDYRGKFLDDALTIQLGVRAPFFDRELNQNCFTQNGTSTVLCTTQAIATTLPNGNVTFAGNTNQFIAPYQTDFKYDDILPNVTVGYRLGESSVYASYSEQIAVPRTDNLYTGFRNATATTLQPIAFNDLDPEFTTNYEIGYRFTNETIVASIAAYQNDYSNRVVTTLDNDPNSPTFNTNIDRNIGEVETRGVEGSIGWAIADNFSLYASATYTRAELQEDQLVGAFTCPAAGVTNPALAGFGCVPNERSPLIIPTQGKQVVETPEWQVALRADWQVTDNLSLGLQGKFVDDRFTTDVNDEVVPSYTTVDFDARYDLTEVFGIRDAFIQVNVSNVFDEDYPINISSGTNALAIADVNPNAGINSRPGQPRTFGLSAPRTASITLGTRF